MYLAQLEAALVGVEGVLLEAKGQVAAQVERRPYTPRSPPALGAGYLLAGGLFTPLTGRVLRAGLQLGLRAVVSPPAGGAGCSGQATWACRPAPRADRLTPTGAFEKPPAPPEPVVASRVVLQTLVVVAVVAGFWLAHRFAGTLFTLFAAMVLGTAVRPGVEALQRRGVSRRMGALLLYAGLLGVDRGRRDPRRPAGARPRGRPRGAGPPARRPHPALAARLGEPGHAWPRAGDVGARPGGAERPGAGPGDPPRPGDARRARAPRRQRLPPGRDPAPRLLLDARGRGHGPRAAPLRLLGAGGAAARAVRRRRGEGRRLRPWAVRRARGHDGALAGRVPRHGAARRARPRAPRRRHGRRAVRGRRDRRGPRAPGRLGRASPHPVGDRGRRDDPHAPGVHRRAARHGQGGRGPPFTILLAISGLGSLLGLAGAVLAIPMAAILQLLLDRFVFDTGHDTQPELDRRGPSSVLSLEAKVLALDALRQSARASGVARDESDEAMHMVESIAHDLDRILTAHAPATERRARRVAP